MTNKPGNHHAKELFKELGIMTVFNLYIFEIIRLNIKNDKINLQGLNPKHNYNTRHCFHDQNKAISKNSTQAQGIQIFNRLSSSLIKMYINNGQNEFLKLLKKRLVEKPYYSMGEYFEDPI